MSLYVPETPDFDVPFTYLAWDVENGIAENVITTPAYPDVPNRVEHQSPEGRVVQEWLAPDWQNDPSGVNIWSLWKAISDINAVGSPAPFDPPEGYLLLASHLDNEGNLYEALASPIPGPGQFVLVSINREEDSYWIQDEWSEEDTDLSAIGAVFGAISSVLRGDYQSLRDPEDRVPL